MIGEKQAETDKRVYEHEQELAGKQKILVFKFPLPRKSVGSDLIKLFITNYLIFLDYGLC